MNSKNIGGLGAILILTLLPVLASAANMTRIAGSSCQPYYGNQAADFTTTAYGITNNSSSNRYVACGLQLLDGPGFGVTVWVNMYNSNSSATCAALSYDGAGNYLTGHSDISIPSGSGTAFINLSSGADGFIGVFCRLPGNSTLRSIVAFN